MKFAENQSLSGLDSTKSTKKGELRHKITTEKKGPQREQAQDISQMEMGYAEVNAQLQASSQPLSQMSFGVDDQHSTGE